MLTLCLIRHAKSDWHHPSSEDINRELNAEGEQDASQMGKFLLDKGLQPNLILSSDAKRAKKTAELIAAALAYPTDKIDFKNELYEASVEELLHHLEKIDGKNKIVFLIGHNPAITMLANYLAEDHLINLSTCSVYCIDFKTENWQEITVAEGKTRFLETPHHDS